MKLLFGLKVRDVDCDFRLMRRRMFDVVRLEKNSGVICLEMMKKFKDAGFRVAEVPVHHYHRAHGKSQFFNFPRIARTGVDVLKLWWALVVRREHLHAAPQGCRAGEGPSGRDRRLLSRPPGDDHRRAGLHRQQPGASGWSSSAPTCCWSIR